MLYITASIPSAASPPLHVALPIFSAFPASPSPMSAPKPSFDGSWSVLIVTEKGTCDRAYRYPVRIHNGAVGYAGEASFNVSGSVGPNGSVTVMRSEGRRVGTATGRQSDRDR